MSQPKPLNDKKTEAKSETNDFERRYRVMNFDGFSEKDFETFTIPGLEERMKAIQSRIQPKFQAIGEVLTEELTDLSGSDMYLHIAKHARRTKNPPKDTWLAIAANKRGYKQHPHFQVGLFDDHVFIWLAFINELANKKGIGEVFLSHIDKLERLLPEDDMISMDHTRKDAKRVKDIDLQEALQRFATVKKSEFLIGKHIAYNDPLLQDGQKFLQHVKDTFQTLLPIYQLSFG